MSAEIAIDVVARTDQASASLRRFAGDTEQNTGRIGRAWAKVGTAVKAAVGASVALAVVQFGRDALEAGNAARIGAVNAQAAFGRWAASAGRWSDDVNDRFGVANDAVLGHVAVVGGMLKAQGASEAQALLLSEAIVGTAGNLDLLSSATGSLGEATGALSAGLRGEFDSMENLNIAIKQSDINARLAAEGKDKLTGSALKLASAEAFVALLQEQSKGALKGLNSETVKQTEAINRQKAAYEEAKTEVGKFLSEALGKLALWLTTDGVRIWKEWSTKVRGFLTDVRATWDDIWKRIEETFGEKIGRLITWVREWRTAWDELWARFADTFGDKFAAMIGWVQSLISWIDRVFRAAREARDAVQTLLDLGDTAPGDAKGSFFLPLPSGRTGMDVPGPEGAPSLAVVHGGERIVTSEQVRRGVGTTSSGAGQTSVYISVAVPPTIDPGAVGAELHRALDTYYRQSRPDLRR